MTDLVPMTDAQAARYVAHTHPLTKQADEKPEDFVLRIVRAYDWSKRPGAGLRALAEEA